MPRSLRHSLAIPGEGGRVVLPTGDLHHADLPQNLDLPGTLQLSGPHTCIAVSVGHVSGGTWPAEPCGQNHRHDMDLLRAWQLCDVHMDQQALRCACKASA